MVAEIDGFPALLRHTASARPDEVALVDGERLLTWSELSKTVDRVNLNLRSAGVTPGDDVILIGGNSVEFVSGLLGALACGAAVATLSPATTAAEIPKYLTDDMTTMVVVDSQMADRVGERAEGLRLLEMADMLSGAGSDAADILRHPADTAVYGYSSGSTGKPKRVGRTHANFMAEAVASATTTRTNPNDVILGVAPIFHSHGLVNGLLSALRTGARLVLVDGLQRGAILTAIETEAITVIPSVPFVFHALAENKRTRAVDWSGIRLAFVAGAALARETYDLFHQATGVKLRQGYGSTEAGLLSINMDDDAEEAWDSVGAPTGSVDLEIVAEDGKILGPGDIGEIRIRGGALTQGYDDPKLDAKAFVDGWFRTGDLARRDEKNRLYLTGRTTLYISTAGFKVDPFEVEQVIGGHPGVAEVVVVGAEGPARDEVVKAVVVARGDVNRRDVIAICREELADFKVPRIVEFRDEIPRSPLGKILRSELV